MGFDPGVGSSGSSSVSDADFYSVGTCSRCDSIISRSHGFLQQGVKGVRNVNNARKAGEINAKTQGYMSQVIGKPHRKALELAVKKAKKKEQKAKNERRRKDRATKYNEHRNKQKIRLELKAKKDFWGETKYDVKTKKEELAELRSEVKDAVETKVAELNQKVITKKNELNDEKSPIEEEIRVLNDKISNDIAQMRSLMEQPEKALSILRQAGELPEKLENGSREMERIESEIENAMESKDADLLLPALEQSWQVKSEELDAAVESFIQSRVEKLEKDVEDSEKQRCDKQAELDIKEKELDELFKWHSKEKAEIKKYVKAEEKERLGVGLTKKELKGAKSASRTASRRYATARLKLGASDAQHAMGTAIQLIFLKLSDIPNKLNPKKLIRKVRKSF